MPSWKGENNDWNVETDVWNNGIIPPVPTPNLVSTNSSNPKTFISNNRQNQIRRDTDKQKNFTVGLYDIDETILNQVNLLDIQVTDGGKKIKVPVFYGSPDRWVSAQKYGYIRDNQGKIILPAIILKRTNSENNNQIQYFNHHLQASVLKRYSEKNKYTAFSLLTGQNTPVNEIYNIALPQHLIITYHFIVWTELVEQINTVVESIQYATNDYWGTTNGFKFRTKIDSMTYTSELQADDDRVVKAEFDLSVYGYILPEVTTNLDKNRTTTNKTLSYKKVVFQTEIAGKNIDLSKVNKNSEHIRNPIYPNLPLEASIPSPGILFDNLIKINNQIQVVNTVVSGSGSGTNFTLPPPTSSDSPGQEGMVSYDFDYYYVYSAGEWKRVPKVLFNAPTDF